MTQRTSSRSGAEQALDWRRAVDHGLTESEESRLGPGTVFLMNTIREPVLLDSRPSRTTAPRRRPRRTTIAPVRTSEPLDLDCEVPRARRLDDLDPNRHAGTPSSRRRRSSMHAPPAPSDPSSLRPRQPRPSRAPAVWSRIRSVVVVCLVDVGHDADVPDAVRARQIVRASFARIVFPPRLPVGGGRGPWRPFAVRRRRSSSCIARPAGSAHHLVGGATDIPFAPVARVRRAQRTASMRARRSGAQRAPEHHRRRGGCRTFEDHVTVFTACSAPQPAGGRSSSRGSHIRSSRCAAPPWPIAARRQSSAGFFP